MWPVSAASKAGAEFDVCPLLGWIFGTTKTSFNSASVYFSTGFCSMLTVCECKLVSLAMRKQKSLQPETKHTILAVLGVLGGTTKFVWYQQVMYPAWE